MIEEAMDIKNNPEVVTDIKVLKKVSKETTVEECEDLKIWDKLSNALSKHPNGAGLSAIQIGYPLRVAVYHRMKDNGQIEECRILNPVIINSDKLMKLKGEGCLSFPEEYINTMRYNKVTVEDDLNGLKTYTGMEAIVLQHEIDHMDGITMHERKVNDTFKRGDKKVGRNEPCPCGSGKKYKKCCS